LAELDFIAGTIGSLSRAKAWKLHLMSLGVSSLLVLAGTEMPEAIKEFCLQSKDLRLQGEKV